MARIRNWLVAMAAVTMLHGFVTVAHANDLRPYILPNARMGVTINVPTVLASPVSKITGGPAHTLASGLEQANKLLGPENRIERVWLIATEDYPRNTLVIIQGRFDQDRLRARFQELSKDRKQGSHVTWENQRFVLSMDVPATLHVIPGIAATIFLSSANADFMLGAFEKSTLHDVLEQKHIKPGVPAAPVLSLWDKLDLSAGMSFVALPTTSLTSDTAVLAKARQIAGVIQFGSGLEAKLTISASDESSATSLEQSLNRGLVLSKQLVPTMKQATTDANLIAWINGTLAATKIVAKADAVDVTAEFVKKDLPAKSP